MPFLYLWYCYKNYDMASGMNNYAGVSRMTSKLICLLSRRNKTQFGSVDQAVLSKGRNESSPVQ